MNLKNSLDTLLHNTRHAFSFDGVLSQSYPGFLPRSSQSQLAETIAEAILNHDFLVAEAGTGTGKTFAYLVPSLLSGKKIVISTATKMLQDQLVHKDLPELMRILPFGVSIQNLKGRSNYLCEYRIRQFSEETRLIDRGTVLVLTEIREKLSQLREGLRDELPDIQENDPVWPYATSTVDNCLSQRCPYYQNCFLAKARRRAMEANVVVINHHLFFADIKLKENGFGALLPLADVMIFDEAHQLAEIASEFFSQKFSTRMLESWKEDLTNAWPGASPQQARVNQILVSVAQTVAQIKETCFSMLQSTETRFHFERLWSLPTFQDHWGQLTVLLRHLEECFKAEGVEQSPSPEWLSSQRSEESNDLEQYRIRLHHLLEWMQNMTHLQKDWIAWGEIHRHQVHFSLTPVHVGALVSQQFTQMKSAMIFTSATLTVAGQFDAFLDSLSMTHAKTLCLASPFDYASQALLYLPRHLPDPHHENYYTAMLAQVIPVIEACQGRCFFLFTSHEALNMVASVLPHKISYPVLVQGAESKAILLSRFRVAGNAVLLGTSTFWEGVDVQGQALSCVIIDKIPFMNPKDPIIQAKNAYFAKLGQSAFEVYSLPAAVIALKQGVGRLIRGNQEKGIVVIADPRLTGRAYGHLIFKSLPGFQRTREWSKVLVFAQELVESNLL